MIRSMEGFTFASALDLNMAIITSNLMLMVKNFTHVYQDCLVPDVFQNVMSKLVQDMENV
jgi:hypothetical protein